MKLPLVCWGPMCTLEYAAKSLEHAVRVLITTTRISPRGKKSGWSNRFRYINTTFLNHIARAVSFPGCTATYRTDATALRHGCAVSMHCGLFLKKSSTLKFRCVSFHSFEHRAAIE